MFRINSNWLSMKLITTPGIRSLPTNRKAVPPALSDPQASIIKAGYGNDNVFLAHVGLILVRVSLGVHQNHGGGEMRGEANRSGLFKNIARNRFIRPRVSSARFVEPDNAAFDIHASPESTIAVSLTLMRLLKREGPAQKFHVRPVDCRRLDGEPLGKFSPLLLALHGCKKEH